MKKRLALLLASTLILAAFAGCGNDEVPADTQDEQSVQDAPEEADKPDDQPDLVGYTIGDISISVPANYSAEDLSQVMMGTALNALSLVNGDHIVLVSSTSYETSSGFIPDDEDSLDAVVEGIMLDLSGQVNDPAVLSQTATAYITYGDHIWTHRNVVIQAGKEYAELDIFINSGDGMQYSVRFLTAGTDKNISGSNTEMIATVMESMTIAGSYEALDGEEVGADEIEDPGEETPEA